MGRIYSKRKGVATTGRSTLKPTVSVISLLFTCNWDAISIFFLLLLLLYWYKETWPRPVSSSVWQICSRLYWEPRDEHFSTKSAPNSAYPFPPWAPVYSAVEWEGWMRHSLSPTLKNSTWNVLSLDLLPMMTHTGLKVPHSLKLSMVWNHLISREFSRLTTSKICSWFLGDFPKIYRPAESLFLGFRKNEPYGLLLLSLLSPSA